MRIGQICDEIKVLWKVWSGVSEWGENEDSFFVFDSLCGGFDVVQVDLLDVRSVDNDGSVMVEDDRSLLVCVPFVVLVVVHLKGRL